MNRILLLTDDIDMKLEDTHFLIKGFNNYNRLVYIFNIDQNTFPTTNYIETDKGLIDISSFELIINRFDLYSAEVRTLHFLLKKYNQKILNDDFEKTNNKLLTTILVKNGGTPVIESLNLNKNNIDYIIELIKFPMVIKGTEGYSGNQVFKVESKSDILKIMKEHNTLFFIAQPYIEANSTDFRIIHVNGKALFEIKRTSNDDFRANIQLGGSFEIREVSDALRKVSDQVMKSLQLDMLGLDFIYDGEKYLFCEANNCYGIRNQDIANTVVKTILN